LTRVIGVVSGKGGTGKTTVTLNIGAALTMRHKKDVIIVDCNITTSHLGMYMGLYYYPISLNHVLSGDVNIDKAVYDYTIPGLKIVPASLSLDDMKGVEMSDLKGHIKDLFGKADIVLLDSAPGFGREAISTIRASDELIYVMNPFVPSLMDVVKAQQIANQFGVKSLGIVLNMAGEGRHELTVKEVEQLTEMPVLSRIPKDKSVLRSLSDKVPTIDISPRSKASREFKRLAANLVGEEYSEGLFSRLFKSRRRRESLDFQIKTGVKPHDI
jgi:septum site-determining protein MinD